MNFADKILSFNLALHLEKSILPPSIQVMNPFQDLQVQGITKAFYQKYFADNLKRFMIIGINPGRFGGGTTGIPFTDAFKLKNCGIEVKNMHTQELSANFMYMVIDAFGGPEKFYQTFFVTAVSPLGFVKEKNGKVTNYNYYDSNDLLAGLKDFIVDCMKKQLEFGIHRDVCFCLGTGKNFEFLSKLNKEFQFFKSIVPLSHPRFVMQYRNKDINLYISKYLEAFSLLKK